MPATTLGRQPTVKLSRDKQTIYILDLDWSKFMTPLQCE